ncbi:hypothetical protein OPIT5_18545 [Opitutaceae bacterium TAV5]|nr:hypothetical protein OPIT5_18545 [Opitutaceae bacterium TAV5]
MASAHQSAASPAPTARSAAHPAVIHNPFPRDDPRDSRACASQPEISHINGKSVAKKAPA